MEFRKLRADELEARVSTVTAKGCSVLIYKDARVDQRVLDETVGALNWQRDHKELKGVIYCGVGIWDQEKSQWIWKWDCGTENLTEKEKSASSDAFKRACFNLGIGRELYTAPFIWFQAGDVNIEDYNGRKTTKDRFTVDAIEYIDNKISYLKVTNAKTKKSFEWRSNESIAQDMSPRDVKLAELKRLLMKTKSDPVLFHTWMNREFKREVGGVDNLNENEIDRAIAMVKRKESANA